MADMGITLFSYDLLNKNGIQVGIVPYGAVVQRILIPTKDGSHVDVVQGYDCVDDYKADKVYYGCVAGRYANRINNGKFTLDGKEYNLPHNRPGLCLHGGDVGFNKHSWEVVDSTENSVTLQFVSPDGDQGFPGELTARIQYSLNDENELHLRYSATTSKPTHVMLTNHSYFNLAGHDQPSVLDHTLQLHCDKYLPKASNGCPTGEIAKCSGSFDFENPVRIGDRINDYLPNDAGIDHSFVVDGWKNSNGCNECKPLLPAAKVVDPSSGRWLEVSTTEMIAHVYTGNFLDGVHGKNGAVHGKHSALCIETQGCPDAPNNPQFPSTCLRPGEIYTQHTVWKFGGF